MCSTSMSQQHSRRLAPVNLDSFLGRAPAIFAVPGEVPLRCGEDYEKDGSRWVGSAGIRKAAFSQHLGGLTANYSYMHYVPVDNLLPANLDGGGGSVVLYFAGFFGLKAEVQGYASENIDFNFAPGSIRCPEGCTGTAQANLVTGNFGPQIKIRIKRVQPFFERLVGGAHTNFYQNVHENCSGRTFGSPSDWALDLVLRVGSLLKSLRAWRSGRSKRIIF